VRDAANSRLPAFARVKSTERAGKLPTSAQEAAKRNASSVIASGTGTQLEALQMSRSRQRTLDGVLNSFSLCNPLQAAPKIFVLRTNDFTPSKAIQITRSPAAPATISKL
jgi:Tfp pilus tip-associated adhesin PilY1